MYIQDVYIHILPDKMAIGYSNHLFVPVAFVFCLLSPLVHTSDSYGNDYTDSRQFKKNPAVSRYGNNIQRLPNYNWKPPDKYYSSRKESTEKKPGMEFTKREDSEQRMADPWIKKMQEISRQRREKWAAYKRNENGKLVLDNVEETTKASKLTNDESITISMFSKSIEYDENVEEGSEDSGNSFEGSKLSEVHVKLNPIVSKTLTQSLSMGQSSAGVEDFHDFARLKSRQSTDATANSTSNKKLKNDRTSNKNRSAQSLREAPVVTTHQRHKDYEISDIREDPVIDKRNATQNYERSEIVENRLFGSTSVNPHPEKSIPQRSRKRRLPKNRTNTDKGLKQFAKSFENSRNNSKKAPAKKYSIQSNASRDDNEGSREDSKRDEKIVTAKSLTRKRKGEKDDEEGKDATGKPLNHGGSFHSRWGMSVSSPPAEFLKDMSRRSMHRKNKERIGHEKDGGHHLVGRWGMSASPPKEFLKGISRHQGHETGRTVVKIGSRPSEIERSSDDLSSRSQSRQNSRTDLIQRSTTDERDEEFVGIVLGRLSNDPNNFRYPNFMYWNNYATNVDKNIQFLRDLKLLTQTLQTLYAWQDDMDTSIFCRMRILYAPLCI